MDIKAANLIAQRAAEFFKTGRFDEALVLLLKIHAAFPDDKKILYNLAVCFGRVGKVTEGLDIVNQLAGFFPNDRLAKLRDSIRMSVPPPTSAAFLSQVDVGDDDIPPPGPPTSPTLGTAPSLVKRKQVTRFSRPFVGIFDPVHMIMLAGNEPSMLSCGFIPLPSGGTLSVRSKDDEPFMLPPDGWKSFVKLVDLLIQSSPKGLWLSGSDLPQATMRTQLERFGRVFNPGELVIAVAELKANSSIMLTDRRLYFLDMAGPKAVPLDRIEAAVGISGPNQGFFEVRLRDTTRVHINLGATKKLAHPLSLFLNELSFLYEWEGTSLIVMPSEITDLVFPPYCCNCLTDESGRTGSVTVRDPSEPLPDHSAPSAEERRSALSMLFGKKETAEKKPLIGPVTFPRCTDCQWEQPVRVTVAGDQLRVFVFQNARYAEAFRVENARYFTEKGL
ncbi:MAG: hypothetical protein AMXMBFR84_41380 [Candidatus Hydrogenedentota bacterium]